MAVLNIQPNFKIKIEGKVIGEIEEIELELGDDS